MTMLADVTQNLVKYTRGNAARLIVGDYDTCAEAVRMIDRARRSIAFETFTFNGAQGQVVTDALIRAQKRHVDVRGIFDHKAVVGDADQRRLMQSMIGSGIDARVYREMALTDPMIAIDHAKLLLVDERDALLGGTNFDKDVNFDLNYRLEGPSIAPVSDHFAASWRHTVAVPNGRPGAPAPLPRVTPEVAPVPGGEASVALTQTGTRSDGRFARTETYRATLEAIANAKTSIDVLMFTFDDGKEIAALKAAKARGVDVRVILNEDPHPGKPSHWRNHTINSYATRELRDAGIPVRWFVLPKGYDELHAKVAVFDRTTALGGSTNWVHSSNFNNHELGLWLQGSAANDTASLFDRLWRDQTRVIPPFGPYDRFKAVVMHGFSWFF